MAIENVISIDERGPTTVRNRVVICHLSQVTIFFFVSYHVSVFYHAVTDYWRSHARYILNKRLWKSRVQTNFPILEIGLLNWESEYELYSSHILLLRLYHHRQLLVKI